MHVRLSETGKSQSKPSVFLRHVEKVSVKIVLSLMNTLPHIHIQMQKDGGIVTGGKLNSHSRVTLTFLSSVNPAWFVTENS